MINVSFKKIGDGIEGTVELPQNVTGKFLWKGKEITLISGKQSVKF